MAAAGNVDSSAKTHKEPTVKPISYMNEKALAALELELPGLVAVGLGGWAETIQILIDNVRDERKVFYSQLAKH